MGKGLGRFREFALVIGVYTLMTIALTYPVTWNLTTKFTGNGGDNYQNMWNMYWVKKALLELHTTPYHTTYLYHPIGHSLLFQTLNPFNGLVSIPLQYMFSMKTVYNLMILLSFVASGVGMYYLARYLTKNRFAAFLAGAIFTFCPYHSAHSLGHLQLVAMQWLPVFTLFMIKTLDEGGIRNAILAGFFLILVTLCSWYYLFYSACLTVILILARRRALWANKRRIAEAALAVGVFWVFTGPLIGTMVHSRLTEEHAGGHNPEITSADIASLFVPTATSSYGKYTKAVWSKFPDDLSENANYLGYVVLALSIYALIRVPKARFWGAAGLIFLIFALGPYPRFLGQQYRIPMPYLLLHRFVPIFRLSGNPERFDVMVKLCLAVMSGYALSAYLRKRRWPIQTAAAVTGLITLLVVVEYSAVPFQMTEVPVAPFYREMGYDRDQYGVIDLGRGRIGEDLYLATIHRKPLVGGYVSRPSGRALEFLYRQPILGAIFGARGVLLPPAEELPEYARKEFAKLNIRYIISHDQRRSRSIERLLKLPVIDSRGGIRVYDCRGYAGRQPPWMQGDLRDLPATRPSR